MRQLNCDLLGDIGKGLSGLWDSAKEFVKPAVEFATGNPLAMVDAATSIFNTSNQAKAYDTQASYNSQMLDMAKNAVSYRVADLNRAGLSPTLAAGSAMQVPSVSVGNAPQSNMTDTVSSALTQKVLKNQVLKSEAEANMAGRDWEIYNRYNVRPGDSIKGVPIAPTLKAAHDSVQPRGDFNADLKFNKNPSNQLSNAQAFAKKSQGR